MSQQECLTGLLHPWRRCLILLSGLNPLFFNFQFTQTFRLCLFPQQRVPDPWDTAPPGRSSSQSSVQLPTHVFHRTWRGFHRRGIFFQKTDVKTRWHFQNRASQAHFLHSVPHKYFLQAAVSHGHWFYASNQG